MRNAFFLILGLLCFSNLSAVDYYWVGGSGDWSDITHWATTSGGTVGHAQAPSPNDNVFFDGNSFTDAGQKVTLNTGINFCRNMSWNGVTNNPELEASEFVSLSIYGSLELSTTMIFDFRGRLIFTGDGSNKGINFMGHGAGPDLQISGTGGWLVEENISVDSMFHIYEGTIDFASNIIETDHLYITGSGEKNIDFGGSVIKINGAFLDFEYIDDDTDIKSCVINTDHLNLDPGTSMIAFTAKDPAFWLKGDQDIRLENVIFNATTGSAILKRFQNFASLTMRSLIFISNAEIDGNITTEILHLEGGKVFTFESGKEFVIKSTLIMNSTCAKATVMSASSSGESANFTIGDASAMLSFASLRDINVKGANTLTVDEGVDLGNNQGVIFTNSDSRDFFWVGGTGVWSDLSHWSFSSGGVPSGCLPSGKDDVYFDVNSFSGANQVVTMDRENIYVHNMTWQGTTGQPEFTGDQDFRMRITGSLDMEEEVNHTFEGYYHFESNMTGNTIRMNNNDFHRDIYFSGTEGDWTFQDNIEVDYSVRHLSGTIISGGHDFTFMRYIAESLLEKTLDIEGSYVLLRQTNFEQPYWVVWLDHYEVRAAGSTIEVTGGHYSQFSHFIYNSDAGFPIYNKVIFSNYTGQVYSYNWQLGDGVPVIEIDSLIYNTRGNISGSNRINYLKLKAGSDYSFESYESLPVQEVGLLEISGSCGDGLTKLYSTHPDEAANIRIDQDYTFDRLDVRDIKVNGGLITANNSIDQGGNTSITFDDLVGRTLYWVDNGGFWEDEMHWSLTSGGPGGECIPTAIDDVFFDENSFSMDFQSVESESAFYRNCHDIIWKNTSNNPNFYGNFLVVNGSLEYDNSFNNGIWRHIFTSNEDETVFAPDQAFQSIDVRSGGRIHFTTDLMAHELRFESGSFSFDDINVELYQFYMEFKAEKEAYFSNSNIEIKGYTDFANHTPFRDYSYGQNITIFPGKSTLTLSGSYTGIYSENNLTFHNIIFNNSSGKGYLLSHGLNQGGDIENTLFANKIMFSGNGEVAGRIETDTLIGAPGKTYVLEHQTEHDVFRYLQMIGNNCVPIELRSNQQGSKTTIRMPVSGRVVANFLQLQDNIGTGGATFNAGARSTNIGNSNVGWIFDDSPELRESGFLGPDRALCLGENVILNAYSFSPEEQYTWNDGSNDSILVVSNPGLYTVEVQFQSNCILRDTVEILDQVDITPDLLPEISACSGDTLVLDPGISVSTALYTWSTGSNEAVIEVAESGSYNVQVDIDGCVTSAITDVSFTENPGVDLGVDRSVCDGEQFVLTTAAVLDNYLWQDGSSLPQFTNSNSGIYWLETDVNSCKFRDSIEISTVDRPIVDIGADTEICENTPILLKVENPNNFVVTWQDGSMSNEFLVTEAGEYKVLVDDNGCVGVDSITINFIPVMEVDLGDNITACEDEEVVLMPENTIVPNLLWSTGSTDVSISVVESGVYSLTVTDINGCNSSDELEVLIQPNPRINLGPDTIVCDDAPFVITAVSQSGNIIWGDGSTDSRLSITRPGEYKVTVQDGNCSASDSIQIGFKECISFAAYIPNAFSPNDDGVNDKFEIYFSEGLIVEAFDMKIFDRWGNRVFETKEYGDFWDAKLADDFLDQGVYIYVIEVEYVDDFGRNSTQLTGDVTIVD